MLPRVPELVMMQIVKDVKRKRLLKMEERKIINRNTITKFAFTVL